MKNLFKALLNVFVRPKLNERKEKLKQKLENQMANTDSNWVKARNAAYLNILTKVDGKVLAEIEKAIDKM